MLHSGRSARLQPAEPQGRAVRPPGGQEDGRLDRRHLGRALGGRPRGAIARQL